MTRAAMIARLAWRETRASRRRLLLFASAISVGVAALVAIASFTSNIETSVRRQARELLGGDIVFGASRPFSRPVTLFIDSLRQRGIRVARETRFASMAYVRRTEGIRLADVRAVSAEWPIYGTVATAPAGQWPRLAHEQVAIVDTALLVALGARIGDTLQLGDKGFLIVAIATEVPGRISGFEGFGSQVFVPAGEVSGTGLLGFGSRVRHSAYAAVSDERTARRIVAAHRGLFNKEKVHAETAGDFQSEVTDALRNLSSFLQFVGLIALLLGGIGVASGVGAFVAGKLDTIAILRCLGASRPLVFAIYLTQAAALGLIGAAAGALLGVGVQAALPRLLTSILPVDVTVAIEPRAILAGLGIGVAVAVLFALRPLIEVRLVSPLQALRRAYETEESRAANRDPWRLVAFGVLVIGVFLIAMGRAEEPRVGVGFAVAIGLSVGILTLAARGATWLSRRLSRLGGAAARWPYVVRQGLANLHRPRNQTRTVVTALGFGVTVLATLYLVQANLLKQVSLVTLHTGGRPNLVFIDIQPDQIAGVDSLVRAAGMPVIQQVAIVPMRITSVRGRTLEELAKLPPEQRPTGWTLRREFRSTYRDTANSTEKILQGKWWGRDVTGPPWPVSLEREVAEQLKVGIGDSITWNVQGVMIPSRVAVIREVEWARFEPNFFAVFPPAALAHAPHSLVLLTRADTAGPRAAPARHRRAVHERHELRRGAAAADDREDLQPRGARHPLHGGAEPRDGHAGAPRRRRGRPLAANPRGRAAQDAGGDAAPAHAHPPRRIRGAGTARWAGRDRAGDRGGLGDDALGSQADICRTRAVTRSRARRHGGVGGVRGDGGESGGVPADCRGGAEGGVDDRGQRSGFRVQRRRLPEPRTLTPDSRCLRSEGIDQHPGLLVVVDLDIPLDDHPIQLLLDILEAASGRRHRFRDGEAAAVLLGGLGEGDLEFLRAARRPLAEERPRAPAGGQRFGPTHLADEEAVVLVLDHPSDLEEVEDLAEAEQTEREEVEEARPVAAQVDAVEPAHADEAGAPQQVGGGLVLHPIKLRAPRRIVSPTARATRNVVPVTTLRRRSPRASAAATSSSRTRAGRR